MKRKVFLLIGIIAVISILFILYVVFFKRTPKQGRLKIISNVPVSIYLENRHIGRSPYEDKVDEGEYTIKLSPESSIQTLSSWQGKIHIYSNLLTFINAQLAESEFASAIDVLWLEKITSKLSEISVITNPDGASIAIDGETKGITPLSIPSVAPGDHTLLVTSPGFAPRNIKVKSTAGYKLIATVKLALSPVGFDTTQDASRSSIATNSATVSNSQKTKITPIVTPKITVTPTTKVVKTPTPAQNVVDIEKPYIMIKETPTGFLRVRFEPSISASEAGRVNPGDKFPIIDTQNGWYQIKFNGISLGWVSGQYAQKYE